MPTRHGLYHIRFDDNGKTGRMSRVNVLVLVIVVALVELAVFLLGSRFAPGVLR